MINDVTGVQLVAPVPVTQPFDGIQLSVTAGVVAVVFIFAATPAFFCCE